MTMHFRQLAERAAADGTIDADEVLALRREAWPDGAIDAAEAEAILVVNDRLSHRGPEWTDFVVEAVGEYVINGTDPRGHVSDGNADWLIERIGHDGLLDSMVELELLVRVLEKAQSTPERLRTFAREQIERAVLTGNGPTRRGGELAAGRITPAECALLRRMIFAAGGDGPARVSQAEAEMLFRLKDATLGADNAPEWQALFVQGVGNFLQGWQGARGISRDRAAELERFMDDRTSHIAGFFGRMARTDGNAFLSALRETLAGDAPSVRDISGEASADAAVSGAEQLWLQARLDADDRTDPLEAALLEFLARD